jgi:hypothetical protein
MSATSCQLRLPGQLAIFWPPHRLESGEVRSVNIAVAAIVGEAQLKPLRDRKIQCVVSGARNFEGVSKFGSLRSENCSIIVFDRDLGDASAEWIASLRKGARSVRRLAGREVFVFPSTTVMDRFAREKSWQGITGI